MDRDAADFVPDQLALPSVQPCSDLDAEPGQLAAHGAGAADSASGAVKSGEKAVAGGVDLTAAEALQLLADDLVVGLEEVAPAFVAEGGRPQARLRGLRSSVGSAPTIP